MKNFYCAFWKWLIYEIAQGNIFRPQSRKVLSIFDYQFQGFYYGKNSRKYFNFPLVASGYFCSYSLVPKPTAQLNICILKLDFLPWLFCFVSKISRCFGFFMILMYANIFAHILERGGTRGGGTPTPTDQGVRERIQKQTRWTIQMFL